MKYDEIDVAALLDRNAAVVQLSILVVSDDKCFTTTISATGASKREQGDVFDPDLGYEFAMSRALQNLSRKLRSRADARLKLACPKEKS